MIYQAAGCTDQGAVRRSNQDSYILKVAQLGGMQAALAVVCDGLGGLAQGELASAEMVRGFGAWFHSQLPGLMRSGLDGRALSAQWNGIVQEVHSRLRAYGERNGLLLGTTVTAALAAGGTCYLLHAGDCRAYLLYGGQEFRMTEDQTLAAREFHAGRITEQELKSDSRQHILLQCAGVGEVSPVFSSVQLPGECAILLCSDGFYHEIQPGELAWAASPPYRAEQIQAGLQALVQACRRRGEEDNMTAAALLCLQPDCIPTAPMRGGDQGFRVLLDETRIHTD